MKEAYIKNGIIRYGAASMKMVDGQPDFKCANHSSAFNTSNSQLAANDAAKEDMEELKNLYNTGEVFSMIEAGYKKVSLRDTKKNLCLMETHSMVSNLKTQIEEGLDDVGSIKTSVNKIYDFLYKRKVN